MFVELSARPINRTIEIHRFVGQKSMKREQQLRESSQFHMQTGAQNGAH